jgi:Holliday junction resolvasome RuvABC DNA-binding subunit
VPFGYTVKNLTDEDVRILCRIGRAGPKLAPRIAQRIRANYKAMDANDMQVMDRFEHQRHYLSPRNRVLRELAKSNA